MIQRIRRWFDSLKNRAVGVVVLLGAPGMARSALTGAVLVQVVLAG
ncbi:hypothetical protein [Marinobacter halodurans]|nr:hypothetical protein [Marinobacter halodurans]